jgi:hypothetical protein
MRIKFAPVGINLYVVFIGSITIHHLCNAFNGILFHVCYIAAWTISFLADVAITGDRIANVGL